MSTAAATTQPSRTTDAGVDVWRRVWRHAADPSKDDALIERERRGPRFAAILKQIESRFGDPRGLRTIELGSGRGDLSVLLARRGARVTLLDFTDAALHSARQRFHRLGLDAHFLQADMLRDRSAWSGCYDVALSSGVIEHFKGPDRAATVQAHYDALRPGGLAIISVPNAWCVSYRAWKTWLELRGWWPYGMEIPYTRRELTRLTTRAGFESVEAITLGFWQSLGDHWGRSIFKQNVDWADKRSVLDRLQGMTLVAFATRSPIRTATVRQQPKQSRARKEADASASPQQSSTCSFSAPQAPEHNLLAPESSLAPTESAITSCESRTTDR